MSWKGISPAVLQEAGVTCEDGLVYVPYRLPNSSVHNRKVFAPSGRTWWEASGRELIPFGLDTLTTEELDAIQRGETIDDVPLIVAEGESDALALREAFAGWLIRVLGLPGAGTWRSEWRAWLDAFARLYVVGDGDPAGQRMTDAILSDVRWAQPVFLPEGEDTRSMLQAGGPRALDPFLDTADWRAALRETFFVARSLDEWRQLIGGGVLADAA